ncbi:hypothetical protein COY95_02595, partial [Candidatus Woesearchaeota archaeon CG_4_10_14_0_8_um_filter_47_5]
MFEVYYMDNEDKTLKKGSAEDLPSIKKDKEKRLWVDVSKITKKEAEILHTTFDLHSLTTEDLFKQNTRIKVETFNNYLFCVFYGIEKDMSLNELDFVIGDTFIITNHGNRHGSHSLAFDELKQDTVRLEQLFVKGPAFIFHELLDREVDSYYPILESIDDEIEEIEEAVTRRPDPEVLSRILRIKRTIISVKKVGFQQREKISFLAKNEYQFIPKKILPYFRDVYDHAIRVSDALDNYREAISNTFDVYMSAVNNNMNEVMKVLSVIATIALPLTVISGIFGTNFTHLPGSSAEYGFWMMI